MITRRRGEAAGALDGVRLAVLGNTQAEDADGQVDVVDDDETLRRVVLRAGGRLLVVQLHRRVAVGVADARAEEADAAEHGHNDRSLLELAHCLSILRLTAPDGPITDGRQI
ncbi:hypothetical protein ACFQV4_08645 [Streptomyces thermocarboxydus]